jgi:ankyrin repeat protein
MDLVDVQSGLGPGSILTDVPLQGMLCVQDEVAFDYDVSLSESSRPRTTVAAGTRRQLMKAARMDDAPAMLQLVADGADLVDVSEALRLAAYRGSAAVVRELVAVGLGVNEACPDTGLTSLQLAAGSGHILVCELLLDAMADPCGVRGPPAISLARKKGHVEVEEVIERHVAAMLLAGRGEEPDDGAQFRRAHVLPRVSPVLSDAVINALPQLEDAQEESSATPDGEEDGKTGAEEVPGADEEHLPGSEAPCPHRPANEVVMPL